MKKCISFANVCAYAALALSLVMFVLWASNVGGFTVVSLDSFVAVIVALLGVIVMFAVGWQIYSVIEINRKIEKLDEKLAEVQEVKEQLEAHQEKMEQLRYEACHFSHMGIANSCMNSHDYLGAFRFYQSALNHSLKLDSHVNITNMADSVLKAIESTPQSSKLLCRLYNDVEKLDKEIRESKYYKIIQDTYEKAYAMFKKKVVKDS